MMILTKARRKIAKMVGGASAFEASPVRDNSLDSPLWNVSGMGDAFELKWNGIPCVFTLSTGRVGTMTLAAMLRSSQTVQAVHEPFPRLLRLAYLAFMEDPGQTRDPDRWQMAVDTARSEMIWGAYRNGKIHFETSNRVTFLAPTLARLYPGSKFIFLHRDPLAIIRSGIARGWYAGNSWDWARITPRPDDPSHQLWPSMSQSEKIAWYWAVTNAYCLAFVEKISPERCLVVRSELFLVVESKKSPNCFTSWG